MIYSVLCVFIGVYEVIRSCMLYFVAYIFYGACIKICCGAVGLEAHPPHHTPRSRAVALLFTRGDPSTNHHSLSNVFDQLQSLWNIFNDLLCKVIPYPDVSYKKHFE